MSQTERADWLKDGYRSGLLLPLIAGNERIGEALLYDYEPHRFPHVDLLQGLAQLAARAMTNAALHRDLAAHDRRANLVNESSLAFASSPNPEDVFLATAQRLCAAIDVPCCDIYSLTGPDELTCVVSLDDDEIDQAWQGRRLVLHEWTTATLAVQTRATIAIADDRDERLSEIERQSMHEYGERSLVSVPLVAKDAVIGLVYLLDGRAERRFTDDEIATVESVCRIAALAIDNARVRHDQEEHARRLTSLLDVGRAITAVGSPDDLLPIMARKVAQALGSPECIIFDYDADADTLTARALFQEKPTTYEDLRIPFALNDSPADRALLAGRAIIVETISNQEIDPEVRASMEEWNEKTCINVPLYFGDEPLGILVLIETERERTFTEEEIELLRGLSEQAAIAMHNARQFERLESRTRETEVLNDIAHAVSGSLDLPEIAAAVTEKLGRLIAFERAGLLLAEQDGALHVAYSTESPSPLDGTAVAAIDEEFLAALRRGRVVTIGTAGELPLAPGHPVLEGLRSAAIVGLFDGDELIGALTLGSSREGAFSESDRRVLEGVSAHLSLAIKNAGLFDNVKRLHLGNIKALSSALTAKDYYTIGHSARVAAYAVLLATRARLVSLGRPGDRGDRLPARRRQDRRLGPHPAEVGCLDGGGVGAHASAPGGQCRDRRAAPRGQTSSPPSATTTNGTMAKGIRMAWPARPSPRWPVSCVSPTATTPCRPSVSTGGL